MIRQYGVPGRVQVLSRFDTDSSIKAHISYVQAKAGDPQAALDLISDLALTWLLGFKDRFSLSCTFVAPHAKEVSGDNAIPQALAAVCALVYNGKADTSVVQT